MKVVAALKEKEKEWVVMELGEALRNEGIKTIELGWPSVGVKRYATRQKNGKFCIYDQSFDVCSRPHIIARNVPPEKVKDYLL